MAELRTAARRYLDAVALAGAYPGHEEFVEAEYTEVLAEKDAAQEELEQALEEAAVLAHSSGQAASPHSITFEVSTHFLDEARHGEWSRPVEFRFEEREGRWDLVMRTVERPR